MKLHSYANVLFMHCTISIRYEYFLSSTQTMKLQKNNVFDGSSLFDSNEQNDSLCIQNTAINLKLLKSTVKHILKNYYVQPVQTTSHEIEYLSTLKLRAQLTGAVEYTN